MDGKLWFLQLSGWPVFLAIVAFVALGMLGLSYVLTQMGNKSVARNAVMSAIALTVLALVVLAIIAIATRA